MYAVNSQPRLAWQGNPGLGTNHITIFQTTATTTQAAAVKKAIRSHILEEKDFMAFGVVYSEGLRGR